MTRPKVEVLPIEKGATPDLMNVNRHTQRGRGLHENSMRKRGAGRSIFSAGKGTDVPVVMGGNQTLEIAATLGMEVINVHTTGNQIVNVVRDDIAPGSAEFYAMGIEDNEVGKLSYNPDIDILAAVMADPAMQALKAEDKMLADIVEGMRGDVSGVEKGKKPNPRQLPLDIIYTAGSIGKTAIDEPSVTLTHCCIAVRSGMLYGVQSQGSGGVCATALHQKAHLPQFIDNDFYNYDHSVHLESVKKWKPKYCTVMDIMTEEQCKTAGAKWFSFNQIIEWAEELSQYAQNVIVIPKYDCIKDIPKKFMLGYSIPTKHGGTPLPVNLFRGRRIHLLGGSWKSQLDYLAELGDDVVSLDNNYINKMSNYGSFVYPDGRTGQVREDLGLVDAINPMYISIAASCGNIGAMINQLYGGNGQPAEENIEMEKTE